MRSYACGLQLERAHKRGDCDAVIRLAGEMKIVRSAAAGYDNEEACACKLARYFNAANVYTSNLQAGRRNHKLLSPKVYRILMEAVLQKSKRAVKTDELRERRRSDLFRLYLVLQEMKIAGRT